MVKKAFLFPGQGAQYPGMGKDFYLEYSSARRVFNEADEVMGFPLSEYIFEGSHEDLKKTEITQPAILATSVAVFEVIKEQGYYPDAVAGFSLGEYSALVAAEALPLEEALPLVQKRGKYMQEAVPLGEGGMVAVVGLDNKKVEELCDSSKGVVEPSNYNCPGQVVISGENEALKEVADKAREKGAKRVIELNVSAPFHCSLLQPVEDKMERELSRVNLKYAKVPVVTNVSAELLQDPEEIKEALIKQVSNPIKWETCMEKLLAQGLDYFIEMSPGNVLTGFMKKISRQVFTLPVDSLEALEKLKENME